MACLAQVRYPDPENRGWERFLMQHQQHHEAIERSMAQVLGVTPVVPQLYPMFERDMDDWLRNHEVSHQRFCGLLSIPHRDQTGLDLKDKQKLDDWLWLNYVEHLGAAERLGTTIV